MLRQIIFLIIIISSVLAFKPTEKKSYKCMLQMTNYSGEGAYIVVSLLDKDENYIETLQVKGDDEDWYHDITEWWENFYGLKRPNIDAVTGATLSGGARDICMLNIDKSKIDSGYKIRFESAVEDQKYYVNDLIFDATSKNLNSKIEGTGFIRYIRIIPQ